MLYEVTVEDPQVLLQPWKLNPMLRDHSDPVDPVVAVAACGGAWDLIGTERGDCQARRARRHLEPDPPLEFTHFE